MPAAAMAPGGTTVRPDAAAEPLRGRAGLGEALTDGEDYELLFAVAGRADRAALIREWRRKFPKTRLTCIGRFRARHTPPSVGLALDDYRGYEHFR